MSYKLNITSLIIILIALNSCKSEKTTLPLTPENGKVKVTLQKANAHDEIKDIQLIFQREDFSIINQIYPINKQQENFEVQLDNIKIGIWKLTISGLDDKGKTIYQGQTFVEVFANNLAVANVQMYPSGSGSTGSLLITITWTGLNNSSWEYYSNNPLITKIGSYYDERGVLGSFVLKESSTNYKMWYFTYSAVPGGHSYIYYAQSNDGLNWIVPSALPALYMGNEGEWDEGHVGGHAVIKMNNKYVMYYTGWKNFNYDWNIGRAVSDDGQNWIKDSSPVLFAKDSTSWEYKLQVVDVEKINNVYYMYYHGKNGVFDQKIGLAYSQDGISWQRHQNNPIMEATSLWEGTGVYYPSVRKVGDKFIMVYSNSGASEQAIGLAYSTDGIVWEKDVNNPILRTSDIGNNMDKINYPQIIQANNQDILYFSAFYFDGNKTINALIKK